MPRKIPDVFYLFTALPLELFAFSAFAHETKVSSSLESEEEVMASHPGCDIQRVRTC